MPHMCVLDVLGARQVSALASEVVHPDHDWPEEEYRRDGRGGRVGEREGQMGGEGNK